MTKSHSRQIEIADKITKSTETLAVYILKIVKNKGHSFQPVA